MPKSAYIHIPFCIKKCNYCDFISFPHNIDIENEYINLLNKEIKMYELEKLDTLYLGGGTPSLLTKENIEKILSNFEFNKNPEITIEINPETVDKEKLQFFYDIGINRVSIGMQSFNDKILKILGRIHTSEKSKTVYRQARDVGFSNISIDLMFSIPGQNIEDLRQDLLEVEKLDPEHVSIYSLTWEKGTNFYEERERGELSPLSEDIELEMYKMVIEYLKKISYNHYEISNFCKKGYHSRHNTIYWKNRKYFGFGLGASGYIENTRYTNCMDINQYKNLIKNKKPPIIDLETIEKNLKISYYIITGLRLLEVGVEINDKNFQEIADNLVSKEMLIKKDNRYILSEKGLYLANNVMMEFV